MTTTAQDMTTMIHAIGNGRFISDSARQELVAPLSRGLENEPKVVDYALGLAVGQGWMLQNPPSSSGILSCRSGWQGRMLLSGNDWKTVRGSPCSGLPVSLEVRSS
jgi:hypothetical protein